MRFSRHFPAIVFFFLSSLCLPILLAGSVQAQVVEGTVTWSEGGGPVVAGAMTLMDGTFQPVAQGVTDTSGHYRMVAPGGGEYVVVVEVEGYTNQLSNPVTLPPNGSVTVDMTFVARKAGESGLSHADTLSDADLFAAAIADACRGKFIRMLHGIVFGVVSDASTGLPIPGADVTVTWTNSGPIALPSSRVSVRSDESGAYLVCTAAAGEDLTIRAGTAGVNGQEVKARLKAGTMRRVPLGIPLYDPDEPGYLLGHVVDQTSGKALEGVEVQVKGTDLRAETNVRGVFEIPDVPWGEHTLVFTNAFYGTQEQTVRVVGGRSHDLRVYLAPEPVEMPPIVARVKPRPWYGEMVGLQRRIDLGLGTILTREEFDVRQPMHLADALRDIPGVEVQQSGSSLSGNFIVQLRNAQSMTGQPCYPAVWVDGVKWRLTNDVYTNVVGSDLDVVEVYRGPAEVPGEFLDSDASCGAIIVWTRSGRDWGRGG